MRKGVLRGLRVRVEVGQEDARALEALRLLARLLFSAEAGFAFVAGAGSVSGRRAPGRSPAGASA
jgi:hypothetical protein